MARDLEINNLNEFSLGDLTILDGLSKFAIHSWVNLEANGANRSIFGRDDGTHSIRHYFTNAGTNAVTDIPKLLVVVGGVTARAEPTVAHQGAFTTGVMHSFGSQWEKGLSEGLQIYWNGAKLTLTDASTTGQSATIPNSTATCYLGRRGGTSERWDGVISWFTIWNDWLSADEWALIASGVDPMSVRPDAILLHTYMWEPGTDDQAILPQTGTLLAVVAAGSPLPGIVDVTHVASLEDEPEDGRIYSPAATAWGAWTKIAETPTSNYIDRDVINGVDVEYRFKTVDTSGNKSGTSTVVGATPATGIAGSPMVQRLKSNLRSAGVFSSRRELDSRRKRN